MTDIDSLWGEEFVTPTKEKEKVKKIREKIAKPKEVKTSVEKQIKSKALTIEEKLEAITKEVYRVLGKQKDNVIVIRDKQEFHDYVSGCLKAGRIDIDTETNNSLDPITCKLMGPCLYAPGLKQAYIPINHIDPITLERLENQLTEEDVYQEFQRIQAAHDKEYYNNGTKGGWIPSTPGESYEEWYNTHVKPYLATDDFISVYHNGKFDYQVIKCTCGNVMPITWDTMIGAKLLDENERSAGLKQQYIDKIDPDQEKYSIDHLFENIEYAYVDPEIFALYAATDALMTDKLYEWQMNKFKDPDLARVLNLANTVEMPLVQVVAEMELNGVEFDKEYDERLSKKYHKKLDQLDIKINKELDNIKPLIESWKLTSEANEKPKTIANRQKTVEFKGVQYTYHPKKKEKRNEYPAWWEIANSGISLTDDNVISELTKLITTEAKSKAEQLTDPINVASPTQLAILFYDILKVGIVDKKSPRATGEDVLEALSKKYEIAKLLLERRSLMKLISAFIDSLPNWVNPKTGRIHCHFNAYGAATGRFSSSDPNLQQIPSHNHELRLLFKAKDGNILLGSDFSQQEPRVLSQFSHDENMINAYKNGKDLYATIAAGVYKNNYEDNLEFNPITQQLSPEGKARRSSVKSLLLGIMYGRGVNSIAEQIHGTTEEAQKIIDDFYSSFPKVKIWIDETQQNAHKTGYVEDLWGRRRRLPDIQLPKYQIIDKNETSSSFNPFLICSNRKEDSKLVLKYKQLLDKIKYAKEYEKIQADALKEGIEIHSNTGFIAQAERQCVNARIQGSSATMTKKAMINLFRDDRLRELGFKLLIGVHDELIGECPLENREECAERLTTIMKTAAQDVCEVPFKCDAELSTCWYLPQYTAEIEEQYEELLKEKSEKDAFEFLVEDRCESTPTQLYEILKSKMHYIPEDVDINYISIYE